MEQKKGFFERWQNPALWLTLIASFWWFNGEMGQIRDNETNIEAVEQRQAKKIGIQNEHSDRIDEVDETIIIKEMQFKLEIKDLKIEHLEDIIESLKERHSLELRIRENEVRREYIE